ncbi:MAG: peptidoglycan DD-metalloendopeptidase family protein, partial [Clostridiales bacterium]|nr:peptidoglycan DD-metalloendopeptidase family protein [Clostridiales bacterium]
HSFGGWNTNSSGTGTTYIAGQSYNLGNSSCTLYAKWTPNATYTVTFNGNNNTSGVAPNSISWTAGGTVTMPTMKNLAKNGYKFTGWNTNPSGTGTTYTAGNNYNLGSASLTLYAKWTLDSGLPESVHNYPDNYDNTWTYTLSGASSLNVTFSSDTETEANYDFIYIMDGNGNNISGSPFSGTVLKGATKTVSGNTVKIRLTSDGSINRYGFRVTSITAGGAGTITLPLNTPTTVAITNGGRRKVEFTAPVAGTYIFESSNCASYDPKAYKNLSGTDIWNDDGGEGLNYKFPRELNAGETFNYYSGLHNDKNVSCSYKVTAYFDGVYQIRSGSNYLTVNNGFNYTDTQYITAGLASGSNLLAQNMRLRYYPQYEAYTIAAISSCNGFIRQMTAESLASGKNLYVKNRTLGSSTQLFTITETSSGSGQFYIRPKSAQTLALERTSGGVRLATYSSSNADQKWILSGNLNYMHQEENYSSAFWYWPVDSSKNCSSSYGWRDKTSREFHTGLDINRDGGSGNPIIKNASAGTVYTVAYNGSGYGNYIIITHSSPANLKSLYAHLSEAPQRANGTLLTSGNTVTRGEQIGKMGTTGNSNGIHLHFEVQINGDYLSNSTTTNPLQFYRSSRDDFTDSQ